MISIRLQHVSVVIIRADQGRQAERFDAAAGFDLLYKPRPERRGRGVLVRLRSDDRVHHSTSYRVAVICRATSRALRRSDEIETTPPEIGAEDGRRVAAQ